MAHLIPPDYPPDTSPGEVLLFDALRDASTGNGWTVLHSLHLPEHVRQIEGEADFIILMPGRGVLCIEVKSHLRADYVDGAWYLGETGGPDYRGPFRQAEMAARSVKKKVASALPWASEVLFWPAVVFTHCIPAARSVTGEWHSWQLLTSADLDRERVDRLLEAIMQRARDHAAASHAAWFDPSAQRPSRTECDHIRRLLRPDVHFLPATSSIRQRRKDEIRRFTEEQLEVIDGLDGVNERALIEGPAGTGKTVLAVEEARRARALGSQAALLCFNQQLAAHLRAEARDLNLDGVDISTFHSLMRAVAGETGTAPSDPEYWKRELPDMALVALLETGPKYDLLVVDEAQDLASDAYLDVMEALVTGELLRGRWRMFGDFERQAIYSNGLRDPAAAILSRSSGVARYRLRRNCRNTPRVSEYIVRLGGLEPGYSRVLRPDCGPHGTPRTVFYASADEQERLLQEALAELQVGGDLAAEDIVVLSPSVDSCARRMFEVSGPVRLVPLPERREGTTSFGTVAAFKGLEAPAVILTDVEEVGTPFAQRLFYVGVSRATDRLRVLARDGLQRSFAQLISGGR